MARSPITAEPSQPSQPSQPPSLKKSTSGSQSSQTQKSILGFFQKTVVGTVPEKVNGKSKFNGSGAEQKTTKPKTLVQRIPRGKSHNLRPAPSSDVLDDGQEEEVKLSNEKSSIIGLPSPITPAANLVNGDFPSTASMLNFSSPSRKVCPHHLSYMTFTDGC